MTLASDNNLGIRNYSNFLSLLIIGIKKHAGKVRKDTFLSFTKIDWVGVNYKVP